MRHFDYSFLEHGMPGFPTTTAPETGFPSSPVSGTSLQDEAERDALIQALQMHNGHRERTADALGISRRTLQYKLKKFGLNRRQ